MTFFDLASLAKPLVTATLAHAFLDLDADRRWALGFHDRAEPLTVRQLLSHSAGLPPWAPYTGEPLAEQLRLGLPTGSHPLFASAKAGEATYSDLGYRLIGELLEGELGLSWKQLGQGATGLSAAPWREAPRVLPAGPDAEAWPLATDLPMPKMDPHWPHDANARAGMPGHAGFGATAGQLEGWLRRWIAAGWPARMAVETAVSAEGAHWGLGLQRVLPGPYLEALGGLSLPPGSLQVLVDSTEALPSSPPTQGAELSPSEPWWYHLAFTGPALFVRPSDGTCVALLCHRAGPAGLLDAEGLRARRWGILVKLQG